MLVVLVLTQLLLLLAQFALPLASGRAAFLFESPYISMTFRHFAPLPREETLNSIEAILKKHRVKQVSAVGHSFGTIITGWLSTSKPHLVGQAVFVDPACFLICLPGTY